MIMIRMQKNWIVFPISCPYIDEETTMKKRLSKMYILTFALLSVMIMTGCAEALRRDVNKKPDDDISEAIYNAVGKKKYIIRGRILIIPMKLLFMDI